MRTVLQVCFLCVFLLLTYSSLPTLVAKSEPEPEKKKQYTVKEFEKAVLGLDRKEIRKLLGGPDSISERGNYWNYTAESFGVGKHKQVQVWFGKGGVVDLITYQ